MLRPSHIFTACKLGRVLALAGLLTAALPLVGSAARADEPRPGAPKKEPPPQNPFVPGLDVPNLQELLKDLPPGMEDLFKNLPLNFDDLLKNLPQQLDPQQAGDLLKQMQQMREQLRKALGDKRNLGPGQFQFGAPGARRFRRASDGRLGVGVEKPGTVLVEQLGLPKGEGLVVGLVKEGSPAAKAGLKPNDILLQLGGKAVPSDPGQFRDMVENLKPNAPLDAVILRKGKQETLKGLTLPASEQPAPRPGLKRRLRGADVIHLAPAALPSVSAARLG